MEDLLVEDPRRSNAPGREPFVSPGSAVHQAFWLAGYFLLSHGYVIGIVRSSALLGPGA